ncbi:MAG: helix-turn-helix domain-containing protein [Pseudonocardiaceae bacterium]
MSMAHIGARVAQARRERGLTQAQLATVINFSLSLVKAVEQGRVPASHAFTTSVARALGLELGWLLGQDQVHRRDQDGDPTAAALRSAIDAYDDPQLPGAVHTFAELDAMVADTERWWRTGRYDRMSLVLPELLRHLYVHVRDATPGTGNAERAHGLLADTYSAVQATAGRYGCTDVVGIAVERHLGAAAASGDPLRPAVAAFRRSQLQIRWGRFDSAVASLQRAESSIADLPDPRAEAVRVQLHLRQALLRARQGDRETADELVSEARSRIRARQLPAYPYPAIIASGLNADMHWMAVAMEAQDGTTALTRARQVTTTALPSGPTDRNRNASWWADLARAYLLHGDRARCLDAMRRARAESPQWVRYHPGVHETLHTIAAQDTRASDGLAELIAWIQGPR